MSRFIGIKHRVKRTEEGEARPTMVAILDGDSLVKFELDDEDAELDFIRGQYSIGWRNAGEDEDISHVPERHRRQKEGETGIRIPTGYEGIREGDTIGCMLGGSGDRLAAAASRKAGEINAKVLRIPAFIVKDRRNGSSKDDDHLIIARLLASEPALFYDLRLKDRDLIKVTELYTSFKDAQRARIGCEQRLRQRFIGRIFLSEDGGYPDGRIEDEFDAQKANHLLLQGLIEEEKDCLKELQKAVRKLPIWKDIFEPIEGCGEVIAAGMIAAIGDIRRFKTKPQLKAYLGVHVLEDGSFARKRLGQRANWKAVGRQSLYQLAEQFNRRKESEWGQRFRAIKVTLRAAHPEPIQVNGRKRYSNAHIHKMARWQLLTKFTEKLFSAWWRLEREQSTS